MERTYSCTSGLIHWASKSALTGVASFSASEARKASCASGEVSCPLISLSIPKIFCRNAAISVTLRSNTVGWSMATLIALDLGRLGVLHRQAAVRDDIAVGHFPGHEHPELHGG